MLQSLKISRKRPKNVFVRGHSYIAFNGLVVIRKYHLNVKCMNELGWDECGVEGRRQKFLISR